MADDLYPEAEYPWHSPHYLQYLNARGTTVLRMVGILRISQDKDDSTSIERQKLDVVRMAEERGAIVVGWAEDRDVSARDVPVFNRPQLKYWIRKRSHEFDGFLAWKVDRLIRNSFDTHLLVIFMKESNKILWSVMEPFFRYDPNAVGVEKGMSELLLNILTMIAEMESDNISIRVKSHKAYLRNNGLWHGGRPPYWLFPVKTTAKKHAKIGPGDSLRIIPERRDLMLRVIAYVMAGMAINQIVRLLNDDGVYSPMRAMLVDKGRDPDDPRLTAMRWSPETLIGLLRNRLLIGEDCDPDGNVVLNKETGKPWVYCDPIINHEQFRQLQAQLDRLTRRRVNPGSPGQALAGVIKCVRCGTGIARRVKRKFNRELGAEKEYVYYYCPASVYAKRNGTESVCDMTEVVTAAALEKRMDDYLATNLDRRLMVEPVFIEASGSHDELSSLRQAIRSMVAERKKGLMRPGSFVTQIFNEELADMEKRLEELEALGVKEASWENRTTGRTFWQEWEGADWPRRRELLMDTEIKIKVDLEKDEYYIEDPLEAAMIPATTQRR